eukprot:13620-Heterococcus_DN1.PRE.3
MSTYLWISAYHTLKHLCIVTPNNSRSSSSMCTNAQLQHGNSVLVQNSVYAVYAYLIVSNRNMIRRVYAQAYPSLVGTSFNFGLMYNSDANSDVCETRLIKC